MHYAEGVYYNNISMAQSKTTATPDSPHKMQVASVGKWFTILERPGTKERIQPLPLGQVVAYT